MGNFRERIKRKKHRLEEPQLQESLPPITAPYHPDLEVDHHGEESSVIFTTVTSSNDAGKTKTQPGQNVDPSIAPSSVPGHRSKPSERYALENSSTSNTRNIHEEQIVHTRRSYEKAGASIILQREIETLRKEKGTLSQCNEKLRSTNESWKEKHTVLRLAQNDWQRERDRLEGGSEALRLQYRELDVGYSKLSKSYIDLQSDHSHTLEQLRECEATNLQLLAEKQVTEQTLERHEREKRTQAMNLQTVQQDNDKLKKQCKDIAAELANYLSESTSFADDQFLRGEWQNLNSRIIDWAQNHFRGTPRHSPLDWETSQRPTSRKDGRHFRFLSNDPQQYLRSEYRRPYFVQSFIWSILVDKVFADAGRDGRMELCGLYWAGSQRDHLDSLAGYLHPNLTQAASSDSVMRKYQKWRLITTQLLVEEINQDPDQEVAVYPELLEELVSYVLSYLQEFRCSHDDVSCYNGIRNIFLSAIKLDAKIHQQWAHVVALYKWDRTKDKHLHGSLFDHTLMEDLDDLNTSAHNATVQLVLAPALVRFGTTDGEDYDEVEVLVKAHVHVQPFSGFQGKESIDANLQGSSQGVRGKAKAALIRFKSQN